MTARTKASAGRLVAVAAGVLLLVSAWTGAAVADEDDTSTTTTTTTTTSATTTTTTAAPTGDCAAMTSQLTALMAQFQALAAQLGGLGEVLVDNPVTAQLTALQSQIDAMSAQADAACASTTPTPAPLGGSALAAGTADRDCRDFLSQEQAQTYFTAIGGSSARNADRLDADRDGLACEDYAYAATGAALGTAQVATVPVGGIDTGDGSFAP